jgi:RimJ/RimL family protein N-acetyltransferase
MDVTIAPIAAEYADGFHRAVDLVARERKYLAFVEAPSLESTREFVQNNIAKGHPQFVALGGNEVVGWCDVLPKKLPAYAHCGVLGMGLLPPWRGRGNGKALIDATLSEARRFGFVRIELWVFTDNASAIALYEKVGFKREGISRDAVLIDGQYRDNVIMAIVDRANGKYGRTTQMT